MRNDRGASTLELAFIAPLLFILALGIVDMGRALALGVSVSEAAQEGLIYAAYQPSETDDIVDRVVFSTTEPRLEADQVTITCPGAPDGYIAVTVDYELELMTPFVAELLGGNVHLTKTVIGEVFSEDPCIGS
jgi:hypothetical protein